MSFSRTNHAKKPKDVRPLTGPHAVRFIDKGFRALKRLWRRYVGDDRRLGRVVRKQYGASAARDVIQHIRRHQLRSAQRTIKTHALNARPGEKVPKASSAGTITPDASVIIPVHNELKYTLSCLDSVLSHKSRHLFEVIVADDHSTDGTAEALALLPVRLIENAGTKGFVGNCNHAAKFATGQNIVLLNNDVILLPRWLDELLDELAVSPSIGIVGSRLISPNGKLQEAGSIVYSNGKTVRIGNKTDPTNSETNYAREVDFISGASIAIRAKLWHQLGGFDHQFSPGYYEDVDLAFRVRELGYKVVYKPESALIHFGSMSFNDATARLMTVNREKFIAKWRGRLAAHSPDPEHSRPQSQERG